MRIPHIYLTASASCVRSAICILEHLEQTQISKFWTDSSKAVDFKKWLSSWMHRPQAARVLHLRNQAPGCDDVASHDERGEGNIPRTFSMSDHVRGAEAARKLWPVVRLHALALLAS